MSDWTWSVAEALLNAVWIVAATYGAALAICRIAKGPDIRGTACLAALAAAAALPWLQRVELPLTAAIPPAVAAVREASTHLLAPVLVNDSNSDTTPAPTGSRWSLPAGPVMETLVRTWLLGAVIGFAYLAFGLAAALRLKSQAIHAEGSWAARERRWASGQARAATLLLSDAIAAPVAIGWLRPAVVFPHALDAAMGEDELERLWLHEAAHLERRDDWLVLLEKLCLALLWFHPAAWALARRVASEREMACDAVAADRSGSRREYARTLTRMAELRVARGVAPALSIAGESSLSRRIEMLLNHRPQADGRLGRVGLAVAATVCAAAVAAVLTIGPLIGLAQTSPPVPPKPPVATVPTVLVTPPAPAVPAARAGAVAGARAAAPIAAPPAPAVPALAAQALPTPAPAPRPQGAPVPPAFHSDPDFRKEMRAFSEEMGKLGEEIRLEIKQNMEPYQQQMRALGEEMQLKSKPFAEKLRLLSQEMAQLQMTSKLTAEQEREIEAKATQLDKVAKEMEQSMRGLEEKMRQLELEAKPDETKLREIEKRMEQKSQELERRIEERQERYRQSHPDNN